MISFAFGIRLTPVPATKVTINIKLRPLSRDGLIAAAATRSTSGIPPFRFSFGVPITVPSGEIDRGETSVVVGFSVVMIFRVIVKRKCQ
jgi:hypothetical protein